MKTFLVGAAVVAALLLALGVALVLVIAVRGFLTLSRLWSEPSSTQEYMK